MMELAFSDVGLLPYLHEQTLGNQWPTLQTMINAGARLVILSDADDAGPSQGWYHYLWDFAVETHFTNNAPADFSCDFNRGDSINDLFILNHFVTDATVGIGIPAQSEIVNAFDFFYPRTVQCWNEQQKFPNFPTVDFYELGETKRAVDSVNLNPVHLEIEAIEKSPLTVYPYGNGLFKIVMDNQNGRGVLDVFSSQGRLVQTSTFNGKNEMLIDLRSAPSGVYFLKASGFKGPLTKTQKLIR